MPNEEKGEKVLLSWKAMARPYKKRSREFYSTVMVLAVLVGIIFFFIEGIMPVLVVAAIVFVVFALHRTEPGMVEQSITTRGIVWGGEKFLWDELVVFWFSRKAGREVLHVLTSRRMPGQLVLVLPEKGEVGKEEIEKVMAKYLPLEAPPETWSDRAVKWLGDKVPLEEV